MEPDDVGWSDDDLDASVFHALELLSRLPDTDPAYARLCDQLVFETRRVDCWWAACWRDRNLARVTSEVLSYIIHAGPQHGIQLDSQMQNYLVEFRSEVLKSLRVDPLSVLPPEIVQGYILPHASPHDDRNLAAASTAWKAEVTTFRKYDRDPRRTSARLRDEEKMAKARKRQVTTRAEYLRLRNGETASTAFVVVGPNRRLTALYLGGSEESEDMRIVHRGSISFSRPKQPVTKKITSKLRSRVLFTANAETTRPVTIRVHCSSLGVDARSFVREQLLKLARENPVLAPAGGMIDEPTFEFTQD